MDVDLDFSKFDGLLPAVVQDYDSGEVLMVGFMNKEAWEKTLSTSMATFFSRSRQELWVKGKTSGNIQKVREIRIDCDDDTVLLKVDQVGGAACHKGYKSCFYRKIDGGRVETIGKPVFDPREVYKK
jgi:phosphoribosyl-AMP cyclohydrolase